jgi:hypothetical protein
MTPTVRTVTLYKTIGCQFGMGDGNGYRTPEDARAYTEAHPAYYPNGYDIETIEYTLPENAIWEGEEVELDLHRGGELHHNFTIGGRWYNEIPGIARVSLVVMRRGEVHGWIENHRGEFLQYVLLRHAHGGFPYRNLRRRQRSETSTMS